jgi:hypothetical protein
VVEVPDGIEYRPLQRALHEPKGTESSRSRVRIHASLERLWAFVAYCSHIGLSPRVVYSLPIAELRKPPNAVDLRMGLEESNLFFELVREKNLVSRQGAGRIDPCHPEGVIDAVRDTTVVVPSLDRRSSGL